MSMTDEFRSLHASDFFVMPNPWDRGSARALERLGFPALATTSSGYARSIGKNDQQVTRDELVRHVADLTDFMSVPLNVDSERLFPEDPGGIAESVRLLAEASAVGCSIEDYDPESQSIVPLGIARDAVAEAAASCRASGLVLTARTENHLYKQNDLEDTLARLVAFREAGAEVLYAPGLTDSSDIARVVTECGGPVNVLDMPSVPSMEELAKLGVRRVSTGGSLYNEAHSALRTAARELRAG